MKIILTSPPFSGHLHPIIAIAKRLAKDKDLDITIVSTLAAKQRVEKENIKFISILHGYDEKIHLIANPETKIKSNPFKMFKQLKENISILSQLKKDLEEAFDKIKPDLVISDFTLPVVGIVANEKGIKWHTTLPSPCVYESNGVPAYLGGLYPPKNKIEIYKHIFFNQFIKAFKKIAFLMFVKELKSINFNSIYDADGHENIYSKEKIYALGMSELEFNSPTEKQFQYVGPVLYSPAPEHDNALFFIKNKKYVLVTMGTHLKFMKNELIENVNNLAKIYTELEFHITMGEEKLELFKKEGNVTILNYIPYDKYLNNYSYVIHHAGTGILYECIKRSIPSIAFPQDYDQFDNAARLHYHKLSFRVKNYSEMFICAKKLFIDNKLNKNHIYFQTKFNNYDALETIYKEVTLSYPSVKPSPLGRGGCQ